jgi:hypothetical protein
MKNDCQALSIEAETSEESSQFEISDLLQENLTIVSGGVHVCGMIRFDK